MSTKSMPARDHDQFFKTALLLDYVKKYGRLSNAEEKEMQEMLQSDEYRDVQEAELTWSQQLRQEGLLEGHKEGRKEGMREMAEALCEVLGIEVTPPRQALLARLDIEGLKALCQHLKTHRAWPA